MPSRLALAALLLAGAIAGCASSGPNETAGDADAERRAEESPEACRERVIEREKRKCVEVDGFCTQRAVYRAIESCGPY